MSNQLNYKGYLGSIVPSIEDNCLHGRVLFVTDLITYEGQTLSELQNSFEFAVENYLSYCKEHSKDPNKSFGGCFNVRIEPDLHRKVAQCANKDGITINEFVKKSLEKSVSNINATDAKICNIHLIHTVIEQNTDIEYGILPEESQWSPEHSKQKRLN